MGSRTACEVDVCRQCAMMPVMSRLLATLEEAKDSSDLVSLPFLGLFSHILAPK